jgi:hypothetical protein
MLKWLKNNITVGYLATKYFIEDWKFEPGFWDYRIIRVTYPPTEWRNEEIQYELCEVFYQKGKPWLRTVNAICVGSTPEEIVRVLEMMLRDTNKDVLDDSVFTK